MLIKYMSLLELTKYLIYCLVINLYIQLFYTVADFNYITILISLFPCSNHMSKKSL